MSKIYDEFYSLAHGRSHHNARGFTNIDCPACSDTRKRGGFFWTPTGGFRYSCFNGGCEFNQSSTGWEPDQGLYGRAKSLFELLGGNISRIPLTERVKPPVKRKKTLGGDHNEVAVKFPEVELDPDTDFLIDAATYDGRAASVLEYLNTRSPLFLESGFPFLWSPAKPDYLITPYTHYGEKVVGYMGRHIHHTHGADRFIQRAPRDYMFQQHLLGDQSRKYVIVVESPLDAVLLRGVATRDNRITTKQVNLLNQCNRIPIVVPDQNRDEAEPYLAAAEANHWEVSVPKWPYKDPGEAITVNGLLWTISAIMSARTTEYKTARFTMMRQG